MESCNEPTASLIRCLSGQYQTALSWTISAGRQCASTLSTLRRSLTMRMWQGVRGMSVLGGIYSPRRTQRSSGPPVFAELAPASATKITGESAEPLQGIAPSSAQRGTQCLATSCSSQEWGTDAAETARLKHSGAIKPKREKPLTQYIVVRNDLPFGMIAAQVAHAAGAGSERHPPDVHVVVLSVPSEAKLRQTYCRLVGAQLDPTLVVESDRPYTLQAMSIGLELTRDRRSVRRVLSSLPLLQSPLDEAGKTSPLEVCA
jgi:hypothetical protein